MRALVIGQGSIGRRHARVLEEDGADVSVVSRGNVEGQRCHRQISSALAVERPDYVVIANETASHYAAIKDLAAFGFSGRVLVEKPLFEAPRDIPSNRFTTLAVAYNLRFHPVLRDLRQRLQSQQVLAVEVYAGQWLPDWRPGTDYRQSYSADVGRGGGVLRDLSHELDLIQWLFGPWARLAALGGKRSRLDIGSDDLWTVLIELESGAALTLQLNYLDRPGRRRLVVTTTQSTFAADVSAATLTENGTPTQFDVQRDDTYRLEHRAMIAGGAGEPCSASEGLSVLDTIVAIERAAVSRRFVEREVAR